MRRFRVWMAFLLLVVMMATGAGSVFAELLQGFSPKDYKNGVNYGNGVYFAPHHIKLYAKPDESSELVDELYWTSKQGAGHYAVASRLHNKYLSTKQVFICYYPDIDVAMMAAVSDSTGNEQDDAANADPVWAEVIYDQGAQKTAWVKLKASGSPSAESESEAPAKPEPQHMGLYETWLDFMRYNAKAHGIFWLGGVSQYNRSIRSKDDDKASFIQTTIIRDLKVKHVRGNWLLVEVLDFERNTPIGWVRWRDNDGNLMVFPNFSHEKQPIVMTGM